MMTFTLAALAKFTKTTSLYTRISHLPPVGMRQSWEGGGLFKKQKHTKKIIIQRENEDVIKLQTVKRENLGKKHANCRRNSRLHG